MPDLFELAEQIGAPLEADGPLAELAARHDLALESVRKPDALAHPHLAAGSHQRFPIPAVGAHRAQQKAPPPRPTRYSRRLGLFFPMGSDRTPSRCPKSRAGNTRESLSTRQSPPPRNCGNSRKRRSSQRPSERYTTSMRDAARSASGCLGDQFVGEVVVEGGELHRSAVSHQLSAIGYEDSCTHL